MPLAAPIIRERLIMLTSTTKTFNLAGGLTGNAIIENPELRQRFTQAMLAAGSSPNRFGVLISTAAYLHGEAWLVSLLNYLEGNRRLFDAGIQQIKGLKSMHLEATYLAWVNFADTGLNPPAVIEKVQKQAGIAASYGASFGRGGETYLRFNLATPRSRIEQALERLTAVFN
jgi:cystathionine beta-lyase